MLTIHADRGSSMTSKPVAFLLADLDVIKTDSVPTRGVTAKGAKTGIPQLIPK
jgi:hypothetical protein